MFPRDEWSVRVCPVIFVCARFPNSLSRLLCRRIPRRAWRANRFSSLGGLPASLSPLGSGPQWMGSNDALEEKQPAAVFFSSEKSNSVPMQTEAVGVVCGAVIGVSFRVVALLGSSGPIALYCVCLDRACRNFRVDLRLCVNRASDIVQKKWRSLN